jgi:drug/metabolite transporter (DMT)-like permease
MYPIITAILSAMLFGVSTPIGKWLLESLPPFQLAGWLYLGAAAGVAPGLVKARRHSTTSGPMGKKNIQRLGGAIGLGGVAGPVLLLMGLQRASAASVALWLNLELAATALLGYLIFKDHLGTLGWCGVIGTILASLLLSWQGGRIGLNGLLLVGGACICWGVDNHLTALIDGISPVQSTFWKGLVAGGINLSIGLSAEAQSTGAGASVAAMVLGAFAYGISITLYIRAAQQMGATRSQMIFSSAPFFGLVMAVPLLGEKIHGVQVVAAGMLMVSLVFLFRDQHAHPHRHEPVRHQHDHNHTDPHHGHAHCGVHSKASHDHSHQHWPTTHAHPHWPDIHHRHRH